DNKYQALIDAGAFFVNKTSREVIDVLMKEIKNKKFIFIDITDTVWIIEKNQEPKIYQRQLYKTDEIFIYYDNKHIVGIDIVQPYFMNALVTIDNVNKFTDVAQACFRMRNLNHGHHVNFVLLSEITINSKEELLKQLINNNQKHIDGQ